MGNQTEQPGGPGRRKSASTRERRWRFVGLIAAALAVVFGLVLILEAYRPQQVAAGFTRVGGETRIETAADTATFWQTAPKTVVETLAQEPGSAMLDAAQCAISKDAPLLFVRKSGAPAVVQDLVARWHLAHTPWMVTSKQASCSQYKARGSPSRCPSVPPRLHAFSENADERVLPAYPLVCARRQLDQFVVFAASADPSVTEPGMTDLADLPDLAVGLALAAHIARTRDVSFVVVPRYLEADPELEAKLRSANHPVLGGLVLGDEDRISEDTRTLLREILRAKDVPGIVMAIQGALGDVGTLVAAILALLVGVGATARGAPLVIHELRNAGDQLKSVAQAPKSAFHVVERRSKDMVSNWRKPSGGGEDAGGAARASSAGRSLARLIIAKFPDHAVMIHLRNLDRISGRVDGEPEQRDAAWIVVSDASVWHGSTPDEVRSPAVLVAVDAIAFVAKPPATDPPPSPPDHE